MKWDENSRGFKESPPPMWLKMSCHSKNRKTEVKEISLKFLSFATKQKKKQRYIEYIWCSEWWPFELWTKSKICIKQLKAPTQSSLQFKDSAVFIRFPSFTFSSSSFPTYIRFVTLKNVFYNRMYYQNVVKQKCEMKEICLSLSQTISSKIP